MFPPVSTQQKWGVKMHDKHNKMDLKLFERLYSDEADKYK